MLGSSHYMEHQVQFAGILSDDKSQNPGSVHFYRMLINFYYVSPCLNCNIVPISIFVSFSVPAKFELQYFHFYYTSSPRKFCLSCDFGLLLNNQINQISLRCCNQNVYTKSFIFSSLLKAFHLQSEAPL
jgi:hypothetical protein